MYIDILRSNGTSLVNFTYIPNNPCSLEMYVQYKLKKILRKSQLTTYMAKKKFGYTSKQLI